MLRKNFIAYFNNLIFFLFIFLNPDLREIHNSKIINRKKASASMWENFSLKLKLRVIRNVSILLTNLEFYPGLPCMLFKFLLLNSCLIQCIICSRIFASWNSSIVSKANFVNRVKKLDDVDTKSEWVFFSSIRVPRRVRREFLQSSRFALRSRFVANRFQRFQYRLKNRTPEERAHVNCIVSKHI